MPVCACSVVLFYRHDTEVRSFLSGVKRTTRASRHPSADITTAPSSHCPDSPHSFAPNMNTSSEPMQESHCLPNAKVRPNKQDCNGYNSNKSPTRCNNFSVYYPDVYDYLQLNMFRRSPAHHQELNDCSNSLWFYLRIVVTVVLCSWSGRHIQRFCGGT